MLPLLLSVALATPRSLLAESTEELFRDPLDLMAQPATLASLEGNDLITLLSARSTGGMFSAGWIGRARRVGLGVYAGGGLSSYRQAQVYGSEVDDVQLEAERAWIADISLGIPRFGGRSIGLRGWSEGSSSRRGVEWRWEESGGIQSDVQPWEEGDGPFPTPASEVRFLQHRSGGSLGFRRDLATGYREIDVEVERRFARTTLLLHDPETGASAAGYRSTAAWENIALWSPGIRFDGLRAYSSRVDLRVWNRSAVDLGGLAKPAYIQRSPTGNLLEERWRGHLYVGAHSDLLVAAHVHWSDLELRVGGRLTASWLTFYGRQESNLPYEDRGWWSGGASPGIHEVNGSLSLPVSIRAPVSARTSLFAGGSVTCRLSWTGNGAVNDGDGFNSLDQSMAGSGAIGVRWNATSRVTLDLATSLRTRGLRSANGLGFGAGGVAPGGYTETYLPADAPLNNYETALSGSGPILGASGSLIIHL